MAITTAVAKQLCTKSELQLFTDSSSKNVKSLNAKELRSRITRARKLQDKYRQLASRQEREARGKQKPQGKRAAASSGATRKKEQAFVESRERFEKQLAKVEAAAKKQATAKKKAAKKPAKKTVKKKPAKKKAAKKATKKAPAKKKRPQKSPPPAAKKKVPKKKSGVARKAKTKSSKAKLTASGSVNRQKHRSADNKRRQARRDTRSTR